MARRTRSNARWCAGYRQGDYADLLIVATPEAIEEFGCTDPVTVEDLQSQAKLYGAWAWGDVYGYIVERVFVDPEDDEVYVTEELDSCWGFYGSDFDWSGLEEAAMSAVPELVS